MKGILASVFEIPASIRNTSTVPDVLPVLKTVLDISGKNNASHAVHISAFSDVTEILVPDGTYGVSEVVSAAKENALKLFVSTTNRLYTDATSRKRPTIEDLEVEIDHKNEAVEISIKCFHISVNLFLSFYETAEGILLHSESGPALVISTKSTEHPLENTDIKIYAEYGLLHRTGDLPALTSRYCVGILGNRFHQKCYAENGLVGRNNTAPALIVEKYKVREGFEDELSTKTRLYAKNGKVDLSSQDYYMVHESFRPDKPALLEMTVDETGRPVLHTYWPKNGKLVRSNSRYLDDSLSYLHRADGPAAVFAYAGGRSGIEYWYRGVPCTIDQYLRMNNELTDSEKATIKLGHEKTNYVRYVDK